MTPAPNVPSGDYIGCYVDSWKHIGVNPVLITGALIDIIQRNFSDARNIQAPEIRDKLWSPGKDTNILIATVHKWNEELVELRPAVIIKKNAMKNVRVSVGDVSGMTKERDEKFTTT